MPLNVRAKGVSLSTATNWAFNWVVGEMTPYLQERIEWRLYPMHGFFCVCSFVLVYFRELIFFYFCLIAYLPCASVYPETKGVPLEEMDTVFGEGVYNYELAQASFDVNLSFIAALSNARFRDFRPSRRTARRRVGRGGFFRTTSTSSKKT